MHAIQDAFRRRESIAVVRFAPWLAVMAAIMAAGRVHAQDSIRISEPLPLGAQHYISCRVEVSGSLTLPAEKGQPSPKTLNVSGTSTIDYHERVLTLNDAKQVKTTARMYRKLDFQRKVGDQTQTATLRSNVSRLVMLRQNQVEVPFSPDGPLTWSELDLVRTDVFTPALTGLFPTQEVRLNDRWSAATFVIQELTDLDKVEEGSVTCQLAKLESINGRRYARVSFNGSVRGVGEDGPTRHTLDGYYLFDLESKHLSYITVRGSQQMIDKDGKTIGTIEGNFVLTRRPEICKELADTALKPLKLEPNEDNTQLLYDNAELGVRFLHPRRWKIAGVRGRQVGVDENSGSGLLLTLEPLNQTPTAAQFAKESKEYFEKQGVKIIRVEQPRQLQGGATTIEQFSIDVEVQGKRTLMVYYVLRQARGGATIAGRVLPQQQQLILQDMEKLARSLQIR